MKSCWPVCAGQRRTTASGGSAPAWDGNPTWDNFIAFTWEGAGPRGDGSDGRLLAAINYGPTRGQCYVEVPLGNLEQGVVVLTDLVGDERYHREGRLLAREGLYLDRPAWGINVFDVRPR